jgi:hypothetical protein
MEIVPVFGSLARKRNQSIRHSPLTHDQATPLDFPFSPWPHSAPTHGTHFPHSRGRRLISQDTMGSPRRCSPGSHGLAPCTACSGLTMACRSEREKKRSSAARPAATSVTPSPVATNDSRSDHIFFFLSNYRCLWILPHVFNLVYCSI